MYSKQEMFKIYQFFNQNSFNCTRTIALLYLTSIFEISGKMLFFIYFGMTFTMNIFVRLKSTWFKWGETLEDTANQNKLMNNLWYRMQTPQTSFETFVKESPKICNNILEKFTTVETSEHDYETLHGACYKKCKKYKESRCHYYSFHNTKPLCNLHVNCDLTIMASEPGNYTIMRMNRGNIHHKNRIYTGVWI